MGQNQEKNINMTVFSVVTISGVQVDDRWGVNVTKSTSNNNASSAFNLNLDNFVGRNGSKFNLGDEVIVKADSGTNPPTTIIFKGILEDRKYTGEGLDESIQLAGRDYSAYLMDRTIEPTTYTGSGIGSIVRQIMADFVNNNESLITTTNVQDVPGSPLQRVSFNHTTVYDGIKQLSDIAGYVTYVDTNKDLHFEPKATTSSNLTFDSGNVISADFGEQRDTVYNEIWVYGDRYLDAFRETNTWAGGSVFTLLYNPHNTQVTVTGALIQPGYIAKFAANAPSGTRYLVSFNDKQIIFISGTNNGNNIPSIGNLVIFDYFRSLPIVKVGESDISIQQYGRRTKVIIDKDIKDPRTAEVLLAKELDENVAPTKEGIIKVRGVVNVTPSQTCVVNLPFHNVINKTYEIIEADYEFNKDNNLADNVLTLKVNKKIPDLTDTFKDMMLQLRKTQAEQLSETDFITRFKFSAGSFGIRQSGTIISTITGLGSGFVLGVAGPGTNPQAGGRLGSVIGSGINFLGDSRNPFVIQWSGNYF